MFGRFARFAAPKASRGFSTVAAATVTKNAGKLVIAAGAAGVTAYALYANRERMMETVEEKFSVQAAAVPFYGVPGTKNERTFIAIKPDGVHRFLIGEIISRFEKKGYKLVGLKVVHPTEDFAKKHYADLAGRPFFPALVQYFSSGPVVAMVWEGRNAITNGRKLVGATNPDDAAPGSIRGDLALQTGRNIIHGSDGPQSAKDEISLWFTEKEIVPWDTVQDKWIHEQK
jgi:nucleoside-diphosphate kinase